MKLLISVRDAGEALDALAGGADIIDAKEPALGPLAPVSAAALQSISAALPPATPLSVGLRRPPSRRRFACWTNGRTGRP